MERLVGLLTKVSEFALKLMDNGKDLGKKSIVNQTVKYTKTNLA
jgi:hypothetical protein